jgi:transcriptional regulator with XRE-family HTH domain
MKQPDVNADKLSKRLQTSLKEHHWTAVHAAKESKVHRTQVSRFLSGSFRRLSPKLGALCDCLGIDVKPYLGRSINSEENILLERIRTFVHGQPKRTKIVLKILKALENFPKK